MQKNLLFNKLDIDTLSILNELGVMVYIIDIKTYEVLYINEKGHSFWGNIIGKKCWDGIRGESEVCRVCNNQELITEASKTTFYKQVFYNKQLDKWLDSRSCIINLHVEGKVRLGIAIDITERKRTKQALDENEQKFDRIIENAASIIFTLTPEGIFDYISPSWTEYLGHEISEVKGKHFSDFVHPDDLKICQDFMENMLQIDKPSRKMTYRVKHKIDSWRWHITSGSAVLDSDNGIKYFVGVANDNTEQVEYENKLLQTNQELEAAMQEIIAIEEELRCQYQQLDKQKIELLNSKQQMEDIIDFLPDATFVVNKEGKIVAWNKQWRQ